jgi:hypothetical protein
MSEFDAPEPMVAPSIRRRSPAERDQDDVSFQALRSLGIAYAQDLSGRVWTDYNLHDPGVTILEQVCYALTELAYRADLPVEDHLAGEGGEIDFERQGLLRPDDALRCRPTTENDYRRVFLDRIEGLADAGFGGQAPEHRCAPGLHRLRLRLTERHADAAAKANPVARATAQALEAYRGVRNLGEDLDEDIGFVEPSLCTLVLRASITGERDPADIVADIYRACSEAIAGRAKPKSLAELWVRERRPLEQVLDGPLTERGVIVEDDLPADSHEEFPASQLREVILDQAPGVTEVLELRLVYDDARREAPLLRVPGADGYAADVALVERIQLQRRGLDVPLDARAVASRHAHRFHPRLAAGATRAEFERVVRPPTGRHHARRPFRSVQEDFPIIYGLGRRGAGGQGQGWRARVRVQQMQGYLALFDQLLANTSEQLAHIRDLFSVDAPPAQTYWRRILTEDDSLGIRALQKVERSEIEREVYRPFDDAAARRGRILDHLLALYGETLPQNTMRQFLDHFDSTELAQALVHNKTQYLRHILTLSRDRGAGFDVGERLWKRPTRDEPEPTTGLQARIALLLGFPRWWARPLTRDLAVWIEETRGETAATTQAMSPRPADDDTHALTWRDHPAHTAGVSRRLRRTMADAGLRDELFAFAINRERFRWLPDEPVRRGQKRSEARKESGRLLLTDTKERRRDLGRFGTEAEAGEFAQRLRRRMLQMNGVCDGLHIVEHILLRPRSPKAQLDVQFHALRATFVFPGWTARTSRDAFRAFAAETVRINCPAHVEARCLFLDLDAMRRFETLYATWMDRLRTFARAGTPRTREQAGNRLDRSSEELTQFLQAELGRQSEAPDGG